MISITLFSIILYLGMIGLFGLVFGLGFWAAYKIVAGNNGVTNVNTTNHSD